MKAFRIRAVATMRVALLLACVAGAHGALELNKGTFDKEVKQSGKNAFIKFLAPW